MNSRRISPPNPRKSANPFRIDLGPAAIGVLIWAMVAAFEHVR